MTSKIKKGTIAAASIAALALGGATVAGAVNGGGEANENEKPIPASAIDQASKAALAHTNGGKVTDTEVGDEEGYYEVEVSLDNGKSVDVHLDKGFNVTSQVADEANDSK